VSYMAKKKDCPIICRCILLLDIGFSQLCVSRKFYEFLPIQFCHERIRIAKSTSVITNVMGNFTVTLSHLPRIVVAAVCTASISIRIQSPRRFRRAESNIDGTRYRSGNSSQIRLNFERSWLCKISETRDY